MKTCPKCQAQTRQVKSGRNATGSQRYKCQQCGSRYTPEPKPSGYEERVREQAVKLYVDGMSFRRIARHLGVNHQSIINWVNAHIARLPAQTPQPERVTTIEMDELFTDVSKKKTKSTS
jgi:transposase-like protein